MIEGADAKRDILAQKASAEGGRHTQTDGPLIGSPLVRQIHGVVNHGVQADGDQCARAGKLI